MIDNKIILLINCIFFLLFIIAIYNRLIDGKYYHKSKKKDIENFKYYGYQTYNEYIKNKNMVYNLINQYNQDKSKDLFNKLTNNSMKHFVRGIIYGGVLSGTIIGAMKNGILFCLIGPVLDYLL